METQTSTVDLSEMRRENQDSPWLFPVRMENSSKIEWKPNIIEAFSSFKKPIDAIIWDKLLRQKSISAATEQEQKMLERWWIDGWKETPQIKRKHTTATPILRLRDSLTGWDPYILYPTISIAAKDIKLTPYVLKMLCLGLDTEVQYADKLIAFKELTNAQAQDRQRVKDALGPRWTLFAADNTILGRFNFIGELAAAAQVEDYNLRKYHNENWNELPDGRWFWNNLWGSRPISPRDEVLGKDWQNCYAANLDQKLDEI